MNKARAVSLVLLGEAVAQCAMLWSWWLGEISYFVPENLLGQGKLIAEIGEGRVRLKRLSRSGECDAQGVNAGEAVTLRLRSSEVLLRSLQLPRSARSRLHQILTHELARQSPLQPEDVIHTGHVIAVDRAKGRLTVLMAIAKRSTLDNAAKQLQGYGLHLKAALVVSTDVSEPHELKFHYDAGERQIRRDATSLVLSLVIAAIFILNIATLFWRDHIQYDRLSDQLTSLEQQAAPIRQLSDKEDASYKLGVFLRTKRSQPYLGAILAGITQLLPDNSYLIAANVDEQQVEIEGYAVDPSGFVGMFDNSSLFSNAAFSGPITQGPTPQLQHFVITMNITGGQP